MSPWFAAASSSDTSDHFTPVPVATSSDEVVEPLADDGKLAIPSAAAADAADASSTARDASGATERLHAELPVDVPVDITPVVPSAAAPAAPESGRQGASPPLEPLREPPRAVDDEPWTHRPWRQLQAFLHVPTQDAPAEPPRNDYWSDLVRPLFPTPACFVRFDPPPPPSAQSSTTLISWSEMPPRDSSMQDLDRLDLGLGLAEMDHLDVLLTEAQAQAHYHTEAPGPTADEKTGSGARLQWPPARTARDWIRGDWMAQGVAQGPPEGQDPSDVDGTTAAVCGLR